jgi:hypothetical protein
VILPKRSPFSVFLRLAFRKVLIIASIAIEPLRARIRTNALERSLATKRSIDDLRSGFPKILILMVYRARNVKLVQALLREVDSDTDVRLWALDEIVPELASQTVGYGPGTRFAHFNFLYRSKSVEEGAWVVLADDDALFVKGGLVETINLMERSGFSLAQPSHSVLGWWTSLFNIARPFSLARDTNYVEQGPIVIIESSFAKEILPLPEDNDMGWGIEAEWFKAKQGRFRIGVIDACRVAHWNRNATSYPAGPEMIAMKRRLSAVGAENVWQLQTVNGHWWTWQKSPSWKNL